MQCKFFLLVCLHPTEFEESAIDEVLKINLPRVVVGRERERKFIKGKQA